MTTKTEDVHSELSQDTKRATVLNDARVREQTGTFFSHTHDDLDLGGRFAKQTPQTVVGTSPAPQYPAGPGWGADPTGIEPLLNYSVDELQPTGEPHEVAASLTALGEGSAPMSAQSLLADVVTEETPSPSSAENIEDDDDLPPAA